MKNFTNLKATEFKSYSYFAPVLLLLSLFFGCESQNERDNRAYDEIRHELGLDSVPLTGMKAESPDTIIHVKEETPIDQNRKTAFELPSLPGNCQKKIRVENFKDLKNAEFCIQRGAKSESYKLRNGKCDKTKPFEINQLDFIKADTLRIDSSLYWFVLLSETDGGGSSYTVGHLKIFIEKENNELSHVQDIDFSDEVEKILKLSKEGFSLNASIWDDGDGACCPSIIETASFEFDGPYFRRKSSVFKENDPN